MKRCALVLAVLLAACSHPEHKQSTSSATGGDAARGKAAIDRYGCTACHTVPGIQGPGGMVGPPLDHIASHPLIAGTLPNRPQTMIQFLQNPQQYAPQGAMPNLGISPGDARDIAAYLYTLK